MARSHAVLSRQYWQTSLPGLFQEHITSDMNFGLTAQQNIMTNCLLYVINESGRASLILINLRTAGGFVKRLISATALWITAIFVCVSTAQSQTQEIGGYTVIRGGSGSIICIGRWVPSTDPGRPGYCEGQLADPSQLTAISARQTADKLDQLLLVIESIDQKLADNSAQLERLIEATVNTQASIHETQTSINQQTAQVGELMHDTISTRVDALSRRVLASDTFRKELEKLKQDILTDIKKYYPAQQIVK